MAKGIHHKPGLGRSLSVLTLILGTALLIYMITVEGEPGALPLILVLGGMLWFFATRYPTNIKLMKRIPIVFLQAVLVLMGMVALVLLIWLPLTEGRATDLDLFAIYSDPFILFGYATSILFFVALYKAFRLLGYIGQHKVFSTQATGALKAIKHCAVILGLLVVSAGLFIRFTHSEADDPAGFLALCLVTAFASLVVATAAAIFERLLLSAMAMKSENDLTI